MSRHGADPMAGQHGAAAVEFAITVSLLLLLVFGIIEFSVMLYDKAVITNASREGARAGIVFIDDRNSASVIQNAEAAALSYCTDNLISFGGPQTLTAIATPGEASGAPLTVRVSYEYTFLVLPNISALFGGTFGPSLNLTAQTVMRME